jgi:hypothetical protein
MGIAKGPQNNALQLTRSNSSAVVEALRATTTNGCGEPSQLNAMLD